MGICVLSRSLVPSLSNRGPLWAGLDLGGGWALRAGDDLMAPLLLIPKPSFLRRTLKQTG